MLRVTTFTNSASKRSFRISEGGKSTGLCSQANSADDSLQDFGSSTYRYLQAITSYKPLSTTDTLTQIIGVGFNTLIQLCSLSTPVTLST